MTNLDFSLTPPGNYGSTRLHICRFFAHRLEQSKIAQHLPELATPPYLMKDFALHGFAKL